MTRKQIHREASKHAAFFKHADQDPDGVLDSFDPAEADAVLWVACSDFGCLCGGKPVEADVFELWFYAMRDMLGPPLGIDDIPELRGITTSSRASQIEMGRKFLSAARADAPVNKHYSTV